MNEVLDLLGKGDILFKKSPDPNNVSLEGRMFNKFVMFTLFGVCCFLFCDFYSIACKEAVYTLLDEGGRAMLSRTDTQTVVYVIFCLNNQ